MIAHFDKDKRNDLVFTISVDENNHIEIIIDSSARRVVTLSR